MAGYRCVNFHDLCRLCCSSSSNAANVSIYATEGLQKKIVDCLSITLSENDKLPKTICSSCKEYIDVFSEFRKSSKNAQKMLEGCLNTSKLRNGGQVYIKDEIPIKKVLKPIQNPSPTKIVPNLNLCNIITATPTKQVKKNVIAASSQPQDYLSSIIQAVGIQAGEETTVDNNGNNNIAMSQQNIQQQAFPVLPQYTFTLDGNTLKTGQIQYKIENASNIVSQAPQQPPAAKNLQDIQNQQVIINQVSEFLKLKQKLMMGEKDNKNQSLTLTATTSGTAAQSQTEEPKNKKPKFNLVLQPTKQTPTKIQQPQIISSPQQKSNTSPNKAHILNIEKILPITHQTSPTKQLVVPIMVRSDSSGNTVVASNDVTSQMLSKAFPITTSSTNHGLENKMQTMQQQQPVLVQMKLQPNADGQFTLTPVQTSVSQQPFQLALSPQHLHQLNFQAISQQSQSQSTLSVNPTHLTVQQVVPSSANITATAQDIQTQTNPTSSIDSQEKTNEDIDDDDANNESFDDYYPVDDDNDDDTMLNESQEKQPIKKTSPSKKTVKAAKSSKSSKSKTSSDNSLTELQNVNAEHSDMAKKQLNQLTNYTNKRSEAESSAKSTDLNLTVCDVCKKVFKRKEFLMQHLKSHIGLRPFKCTEPTCNKAFSRKEHLLRHISSHTGTKEFVCNVCNKLFSRKDNLNKHRRIHPENNQQARLNCQKCGKNFPFRSLFLKHQAICDNKVNEDGENTKEIKAKSSTTVVKKTKNKNENKQEPTKTVTIQQSQISSQQQQPKLVQVLQTQQPMKTTDGQTQQLITLSMSQAQSIFSPQSNQSKAIYTLPTNFILNPNGTIGMAATNTELKFDTQ